MYLHSKSEVPHQGFQQLDYEQDSRTDRQRERERQRPNILLSAAFAGGNNDQGRLSLSTNGGLRHDQF